MLEGYIKLENGVIKQKDSEVTTVYNVDYSDKYNSYGIKTTQISHARLGYLVASLGRNPNSVLDVGYGNGSFLETCAALGVESFGNDISGYDLREDINFVEDITLEKYDVITFFDSLEHFDNIDFVSSLKCNYVMISLPWCHYFSDDWFGEWKHRRKGEHIWHFNDESLVNYMKDMGFDLVNIGNIEDVVRTSDFEYENILTGVFKKTERLK